MYLTDYDILECVAILSIGRSTLLSFKSVKPVQKAANFILCQLALKVLLAVHTMF